MPRFIVAAVLAVVLCGVPVNVYADSTTVIDVGAPKGVIGYDGIQCTGQATQDGYTLVYTNYVGADAGQMATNPQSERQWQLADCRWMLERDMSGWFLYRHGITLDTQNILLRAKQL